MKTIPIPRIIRARFKRWSESKTALRNYEAG